MFGVACAGESFTGAPTSSTSTDPSGGATSTSGGGTPGAGSNTAGTPTGDIPPVSEPTDPTGSMSPSSTNPTTTADPPASTTPATPATPAASDSPSVPAGAPPAAPPPGNAPVPPSNATVPSSAPSAPSGSFADGVRVHLQRTFAAPSVISFGLPVPAGALGDAATVRVTAGGVAIAANVKEILAAHDASGKRVGVRSLLVQLPATVLSGDSGDVDVAWRGQGAAPGTQMASFTSDGVSAASSDTVSTAVRTIATNGGVTSLVESAPVQRTLFTGREPRVLATYPDGYLAATAVLGNQATETSLAAGAMNGLSFFSDYLRKFGVAGMNADTYALNPDAVADPVANPEGWLYDRCATFLTFYTHTQDARFLREAYRSCSYYASKISLGGANIGIFTGKSDPDTKYSHLRGLYAYYALTGDDAALAAGTAIANMWLSDTLFVAPYRAGHIRGADKLWTERLLGTSLEGLYYGHRLTGDASFLQAFKEMFETAYRHITGDAATLASINPGVGPFPAQSCFIHSSLQHGEGNADQPWCSTWMSDLLVDPLLQYQNQTGDARVDEIFVRLVRYLRDVGSQYMRGDVEGDSFLQPKSCYDPSFGVDTRRLVPLYGSGLDAAGVRQNYGQYDDFQHCSDATALTSAGIRALVRQGKFNSTPVGPFATEGDSFLALHHEFAACARQTFQYDSRPRRDPAVWSSADLAGGAANPAGFIATNLIGYPRYPSAPQRMLSWWFNSSMLQFGLLADAGVKIPALQPGRIQPAGCK
ncbi:MAG TPA: hypothetical protein VNO55_11830 [Polyangia bacterium]|nr:hypothetical protein [Polyangia bacterium]